MEITYKQKLAKYWKHNINPITGIKEDKYEDQTYLNAKAKKEYNSCMDFIEERKLDRYYSEQIK